MKATEVQVDPLEVEVENTVKGTMFSLGIVGFVILLAWLLLFVIYMYRY
ncbi:hypothetical protein QWT69_07520 [Sporosarcina oncorhynchi]|uniref:Cytochrome c oxidase subunit 2A n=1 Tax=Sporosarcina oncorhynchi TaxID=3056444 RepID=A0ABZ0L8U1_9BACL|nr:hypothetical protein [Sporosarcina sp. T2O-4]WOV88943.1 hypothetical protein QWT69_07520 [Sporosarcina sp. T2O-4]